MTRIRSVGCRRRKGSQTRKGGTDVRWLGTPPEAGDPGAELKEASQYQTIAQREEKKRWKGEGTKSNKEAIGSLPA